MQRSIVTLPISAVNGMLSAANQRWYGQPDRIAHLTRRVGIPWQLLSEPGGRVTATQFVALCNALAEELDDECLGFLSRPLRRGTFAMITRSILGSATVKSALNRVARALTLVQDDLVFTCSRKGRLIGLVIEPRPGSPAVRRFGYEFLLRVCWQLTYWMQGNQVRARRFDFSFPKPHEFLADDSEYKRIFAADQRFSQPGTAVWFDHADLDKPLRISESDIFEFLQAAPDIIFVSGLVPVGTSARVQAQLRHSAPAWPGLPEIAERLGMSVSGLQRHLASEQTSFLLIKNGLRLDMAVMALTSGAITLSALADELGFSDYAAFHRAFKDWTGSAPGQYRERMRRLHRQV